jgi:3-hydroxyisobutyrate dehydrogenase-like beta-hydroxyacid dehydrogenase
MAGHLAKAGYPLKQHDLKRAAADRVAAAHERVLVAESPKAVAEVSDTVIAMLPSGESVSEVALEDSGR